jgi:DNA end-binding protein Ku
VTCPVALFSANHDRGSLHFNLINPKTGNRIRTITQDAITGEEVARGDLVKGFEFKKNSYVVLTEQDFEDARIESSATIKIDKFVDVASVDPIYFDASYYMAPDGDAGEDVYAVLRDAIADAKKMALARVVITRRERAIGIMPMANGLVAHTLHEDRDLNDAAELFRAIPAARPDPEMIKLATQLIARQSGKYDPADAEDRYEARLRALIDAKIKGEGLEPAADERPDHGNVIDLMAALRRSLGQSPDKPAPKASRSPAGQKPAAAKRVAARGSRSRRT